MMRRVLEPHERAWVDEMARFMVSRARKGPDWLELAYCRGGNMPIDLFAFAEALAQSVLIGELPESAIAVR